MDLERCLEGLFTTMRLGSNGLSRPLCKQSKCSIFKQDEKSK